MRTNITKWLTVMLVFAVALGVNAQQTKRNLVVNSNFEEGLKNWRWDGILDGDGLDVAVVSVEEANPISGTQSVKVEMIKNVESPWQVQLYTFIPVEEYAKYKIQFKAKASADDAKFKIEVCETYDNHTGFKPLDIDEWNEDLFVIDNSEINDMRGTMTAGTEVQDYEFITTGNQFGYPNYIVAFHFGHATEGVTFWIDDIKISRCDDGDWDGNMFPVGNFESDRGISFNNQGYFIDGRTANPESVAYLTEDPEEVITGNKTFYIYKAPGENSTDFWALSYNFQLWQNDATKFDISLKGKSTKEAKLMMRVLSAAPWGWGGGDWYQWELPFTTELQTIRPDRNNAIGWHGKAEGTDYGSVSPLMYGWDPISREGYRGRISLFGSLLNDGLSVDPTPDDVGFWLDDVVIKEANLYLNKFEVEYAPETVEIGETVQFKIGDIVKPTHAPTEVEFWVENDTGEAEIDQDGVLTGVKEGEVTVCIDTPNMSDYKEFIVNVTGESSGIHNLNDAVIQLSSTMVNVGDLIEVKSPIQVSFEVYDLTGSLIGLYGVNSKYIRTNGFASGTYMVRIKADNNLSTVRKFVVK